MWPKPNVVRQLRTGIATFGLVTLLATLAAVARGQKSVSNLITGVGPGVKVYDAPLGFEENRGQMAPDMRFVARMNGLVLWLGDKDATIAMRTSASSRAASSAPSEMGGIETLRLRFPGSETNHKIAGEERLPGKVNYFLGHDPSRWKTGIPTFARVRYKELYPGVDLVYYGSGGKLEYDFVVAPDADPASIRMRFEGARRIHITTGGDLVVAGARGNIRMEAPKSYQEIDGRRIKLRGGFRRLDRDTVSFTVGGYDHKATLVIDPLLTYATLLGGADGVSSAAAIATDAQGNAYVTGQTLATDFPVSPAAYQKTNRQGSDNVALGGNVFVTKLNPQGTGILYSTYLGGASDGQGGDQPFAIAVDSEGNAYVAGEAVSSDFPTTKGALRPNRSAAAGINEGFVAEFGPDGENLVYSTFIGGSQGSNVFGVAVDAKGSAYLTGNLSGTEKFQTTPGAFIPKWSATAIGLPTFVAKLNPAGSAFEYSTFLGGSEGNTVGYGIEADSSGNAYVGGATSASNFPITSGAFETVSIAADQDNYTGFVTKLDSKGSALVYSTYLGGSWADEVHAIAIDGRGNAYLTGATWSYDFPVTAGAFQTIGPATLNPTPIANAFVTKMNAEGSGLEYSSYLGGGLGDSSMLIEDIGYSIAVGANGDAIVGGSTFSVDFPVTRNAFQMDNYADEAAFLTQFNPAGTGLIYSTYISGRLSSAFEMGAGAALDAKGNAYVVGSSNSVQFPTTSGAFQTTLKGPQDAFVAKFNMASSQNPPIAATPKIEPGSGTYTSIQTITMTDATPGASIYYTPDGLNPAPPNWALYQDPFQRSVPAKMRAVAVKAGWRNSGLAAANLNIVLTANPPGFDPPEGTYSAPVTLRLTDSTPDPFTEIFYTTDGAMPTIGSVAYTRPLVLNQTTTVKAIAVAMDGLYNSSAVVTQTYTLGRAAAAPTFSPPAGNYSGIQLIKLSSTTPDAVIYYTRDRKTPGASSTRYKTPISVSAPGETIQAIATAGGYLSSTVSQAAYSFFSSPSAMTEQATKIGPSGATLNATVEDRGAAAKVWFVWGTNEEKLDKISNQTAAPADKSSSKVAIAITGLASKKTYYFRAAVSTAGGTSYGHAQKFETE